MVPLFILGLSVVWMGLRQLYIISGNPLQHQARDHGLIGTHPAGVPKDGFQTSDLRTLLQILHGLCRDFCSGSLRVGKRQVWNMVVGRKEDNMEPLGLQPSQPPSLLGWDYLLSS